MKHRSGRVPALAGCIVLAACSGGASDGGSPASTDPPLQPGSAGAVVTEAAADLAAFWAAELPRAGARRFGRAPGAPVLVVEGGSVECDGATIAWPDMRGNALYCPDSDRLAIDAQEFAPDLRRRFGPLGLAAVVAHEYGHAVQRRLEPAAVPPVVRELQADCLAGAWLGGLRSRPAGTFRASDDELAAPLVAVTTLRDRLGADPAASDAHGNGFDRLAALLDGIDRGTPACFDYPVRPPALTGQPFLSETDRATAGDQPFQPTLLASAADLNDHYGQIGASSGRPWVPLQLVQGPDAGCPQGRQPSAEEPVVFCGGTTVAAAVTLLGTTAAFGDMAIAAEVARQWAAAATSIPAWGLPPSPLTTECLTGFWLGTLHPNAPNRQASRRLRLSPGDLDEVAVTILRGPPRPQPVERLRALRRGFVDGIAACRT